MVRKFPKLDLNFLEEELDEEAGLSSAAADPSSIEPTSNPSEPTMEARKLAQEPEVVESTPTSSTAAPSEVEDLK